MPSVTSGCPNFAFSLAGVQVEAGALATSYAPNLLDHINNTLPYAGHDPAMKGAVRADASVVGLQHKNLVVNGNNCNGAGTVSPGGFGWTLSNGTASIASNGTYVTHSSTYNVMQVTAVSGAGRYQNIPVVPGKTYTIVAAGYSDTGAVAAVWVGNTALTASFGSTSTVPLGVQGPFYDGCTSNRLALGDGNSISTSGVTVHWEVLGGTFTVPTGVTQACILLRNSGSSGTAYFAGVQVYEGNVLQDYLDHELNAGAVNSDIHIIDGTTYARVKGSELATGTVKQLNDGTRTRTAANVASVIDGSGNVVGSACFKTNMPNTVVSFANAILNFNCSSGTTHTTVTVWITNNRATPGAPTWTMGDGTVYTTPTGSTTVAGAAVGSGTDATNYLWTSGSITSGTNYWFIITWTPTSTSTGSWSISAYTSQPTDAQIASAYADGTILAVYSVASATGAFTATPGTGGTHSGGGGHVPPEF